MLPLPSEEDGGAGSAQQQPSRSPAAVIQFQDSILNREKFFNEDEISIRMKEVIKERDSSPDRSTDECCKIAESMIEEIHHIALPGGAMKSPSGRRHRGSIKDRLLRQIRAARKVALA